LALEQTLNASLLSTEQMPPTGISVSTRPVTSNALQPAQTLYDSKLISRTWTAAAWSETFGVPEEKDSTVVKIITPKEESGVVRMSPPTVEIPREMKLQEWEGQVQEVRDHYFLARLTDLTTRDTEETEEAEFPISDIVEGDRDLLVPGAVFRLLIAYKYENGEKSRFTRLTIPHTSRHRLRESRSRSSPASAISVQSGHSAALFVPSVALFPNAG
jgi:hypothetical protein